MISNVTINGRPIGIFEGYVPPGPGPGPEPEPFVQYYHTTFKPRSGYTRLYWDPISGKVKYFNNSYSKDLTAGTQFQTNNGSGDWPDLRNLDSTHLYEFVWSDEDMRRTWSSGATTASYDYSTSDSKYPSMVFGELYSLDLLWTNTNTSRFPNVTLIPQDYRNIWRGDYFTNCSYMFLNAPITNSIEKFILAMQQACPNLATTTGCFSGCTTAPDYNYCLTTYPNWF